MSEYSNGVSLEQSFEMDKEKVEQALKGKLMYAEDENGFLYEKAPNDACHAFILDAYDNAVYWALDNAKTTRILNRIITENLGVSDEDALRLYLQYKNEEEEE